VTAPARTAALQLDDDLLVLHGRPLRDGVTLENTARFTDDIWPLHPAILQRHERGLNLNFKTVPVRYLIAAKQVCYALLSVRYPQANGGFRSSTSWGSSIVSGRSSAGSTSTQGARNRSSCVS
jgi:hypothetical protein